MNYVHHPAELGVSTPLVSVQNLKKAYPTAGGGVLQVLGGVSLDVARGEVVAIDVWWVQ